jgi:predicted amidophosphoribosyltransferase
MGRGRIAREEKTVSAMVRLFCAEVHGRRNGLCPDCAALLTYARERLARCPYQARKPTCAKCPIHCYRPRERERIRAVMRHAGPRMLLRHPILALLHLLDSRRPARPLK